MVAAELGGFWKPLEILDLKKSGSMISVLDVIAESDFGSVSSSWEGSDYIVLVSG